MNFDYDVVIIGGAFSGTVTALMLKRKRPDARVLTSRRQPNSIVK
jgi:2-polyprenyl-6-methoxyphenol hydroxylase-like FAD-dependent oxidoreductase